MSINKQTFKRIKVKLFDYYRSTASYRVRIALNLKGISYDRFVVHLTNNGGEQFDPKYISLNPQGLVPALQTKDVVLNQSLAIIEYLDEIKPKPSLLPSNSLDKAMVRSISQMIACDIHPLNNLRVLNELRNRFKASDADVFDWYHHWLKKGFDAIEKKLQQSERIRPVCFGDQVSMADICLVPQVYNAVRFDFPLENYPLIRQINKHCLSIDSFKQAEPDTLNS